MTKDRSSIDAEQSVIGRMLTNAVECAETLGGLKADHFFSEAHRAIFAEIIRMVAKGQTVDVITVAERLNEIGLDDKTGGLAYLGEIAANTIPGSSVRQYADIVIGRAMERQLISASEEIARIVGGFGSTKEKLSAAQSAVMAITESVSSKQPRLIRDVMIDAIDQIEKRSVGNTGCLPTYFSDIDVKLSGGMRPGNVLVVAGRPAMGKTAFAVNIALHVAKKGSPALVLSQEMSDLEVVDRLIAQAGRIPLHDVMSGNMAGDCGDRIMSAVGILGDLPLLIDDQGGLTLFDVVSKARAVRRKHGLSLLVLDYLQLMSGEGDSRNNEIDAISRGIKALAKELEIPIILLSQLNRSPETRNNRRPIPSDLRDSGAIEQDADVIIFVYRDEVYNPDSPDKGTAEIIIGKNRQGATGTVRMAFQGDLTMFSDLAHGWQPEPIQERTVTRRGRGNGDY